VPAKRRIAAVLQIDHHYARAVTLGIRKYLRGHPTWVCETLEPLASPDWSWIGEGRWDGVVGYVVAPELLRTLAQIGLPAVTFSNSTDPAIPVPRVVSDDLEVGRLAARHLLDRGLRAFAYFGSRSNPGSSLRRQGFREMVAAAGSSLVHIEPTFGLQPGRSQWVGVRGLADLVSKAPGPVGVFCHNDHYARMVIHFCALQGLVVPDQVAVVGVDNSEVAEGLAEIPITSVVLRCERIGFEAMALLARLMDGETAPGEPVLIAPERVVVRASSDLVAVDDPLVARALELARELAFRPVGIEDLLARLPFSRRVLEKRFRAALGRSPYSEILRLREEHAKQMLAETQLSVAEIAEACGFTHPKQLFRLFATRTGMTPATYRKRFSPPR